MAKLFAGAVLDDSAASTSSAHIQSFGFKIGYDHDVFREIGSYQQW